MLTAAEMYIHGVSTRRVEAVFQAMGIDNYSAEQVSNASKILDEELIKWRTRRITQCVKVIYVDATYQKVRIDGVAVNLATFIVTGILEDGHRTILAVDSDISEAELHWRRVFRELIDRGLRGVKLIVSDAHEGLAAARQAVFSGVPWQRCQLHLQQNAQAYITKRSLKEQVASDIRAIFNASSMDEAKRLLDIMVEKYAKDQQKLSAWMRDNIPEGLIVFMFPEHMRKKLRTNNIEERINRSIKARTRIISVFPNQMSQLRLVSAICMEISDDWETGTTYLNVNEL
jgi:transposase-like protein